ncbi:hypothetical protein AMS68_005308 [Peltaster fructicola]|uniref:rRNA methyltransferase 2, mitochondrial n=1 Tax=Peltaster fructicola TaxID=286661 RepID=A0A6H0XYQ4_9PEZI|nr:hypothetical protein AMS68_005308 [Peltaster fructicola]
MLVGRHSSVVQSSNRISRCLYELAARSQVSHSSWSSPTTSSSLTISRAASGSSTRWLTRQGRDPYTRASKLNALKSRAAFKLLEIDEKHHIFKPGQTVVDLGYAPGSWSQVAVSRVRPGGKGRGRVVGIDVIPAQPPKGVSTIQGDFLSPSIRQLVLEFVRDANAGRAIAHQSFARSGGNEDEVDEEPITEKTSDQEGDDQKQGRVVDVVLSDMMMNTSGNAFKDHAGSMDLCLAALSFSYDTLVSGGHFVCKYYQGGEEKDFETRLKTLFEKVHRIKPDSSRKESREAYFLGLRRKADTSKEIVFPP